jgi:hypothetical protein
VARCGGLWLEAIADWDKGALLTWRDERGAAIAGGVNEYGDPFDPTGRNRALRDVRIVLTIAHLNHTPGDDRDENLMVLCSWCHLNYDKLHHAETRATRKDQGRPLLANASPIAV